MKFKNIVLSAMLGLPVAASAVPLLLPNTGYLTYGNTNSYSLPLLALGYAAATNTGAGPGNPFYISSTPGAIQDTVVIYTGSNGTGVTTNVAGFENAYGAPNGAQTPYAYIAGAENVTAPTGLKPEIINKTPNSWDASIKAMRGFLSYFPQVDRRIWTQLGARVERAY